MHVGVDVGGTFTDISVSLADGGGLLLHKVASTPEAPERAVVDGLSEILERNGLSAAAIRRLAHGTTVGTNALIQRKCGKVAVVTSEGFRDLIEIGRQTRPTVYDMHKDHPPSLVDRSERLEVPQRTLANGTSRVPLDEEAVARAARALSERGVDCVVVCFLHSYAHPEDENRAAEMLRGLLPDAVSVLTSSSVYPEFREYERFSTAVLNGALLTVVGPYLDRLASGAERLGIPVEVKIGQSSGGLMSVRMARQLPVRACLSGPAAGVQGASRRAAGMPKVITLDVGGTSADVALLLDGRAAEVGERDLAGFPIRIPALDVVAVGAGGGSVAWVGRDGLLKVGPRSAGAVPGPACYSLGGTEATLTDANVVLGRLNRAALLGGRMPIECGLAESAISGLARQLGASAEETALGIVRVACATMVKAIRSVSLERGHDPREFSLFAYGGAGPLHASDVARELGIRRVAVPPNPGILCAEGALGANLAADFVSAVFAELDARSMPELRARIGELESRARDWFKQEKVKDADRRCVWTAAVRYFGQNFEIQVPIDPLMPDQELADRLRADFQDAHRSSYGFASPTEPVQLVHVAAKAVEAQELPPLPLPEPRGTPRPKEFRKTMFGEDGFIETPVFDRRDLGAGARLEGPAIIEQMDATVLVYPECSCVPDDLGNLLLEIAEQ